VKSLAGLLPRRKKDQDSISIAESLKSEAASYWEEMKDKVQENLLSIRRKSSFRRKGSIYETSSSRKMQVDARRHSTSVLNVRNVTFSISGEEEEEGGGVALPPTRRKVTRKDMLICWQDPVQVKQIRKSQFEVEVDLLTRLCQRTYTSHLARYVMSYMNEEDFLNMYQVCEGWRAFLEKNLPYALMQRILSRCR